MFIGTNRNGSVHTCKRDYPSYDMSQFLYNYMNYHLFVPLEQCGYI